MSTQSQVIERRAERGAQKGSVFAASLWMVGLPMLLFFVPILNGLIGGAVGGYKVGTVGGALVAAVLPAVVVSLGLWTVLAIYDAPVLGALAGTAAGVLVALASLGIFVGAALGATFRQHTISH
jgi:uncharacterized membrane protein